MKHSILNKGLFIGKDETPAPAHKARSVVTQASVATVERPSPPGEHGSATGPRARTCHLRAWLTTVCGACFLNGQQPATWYSLQSRELIHMNKVSV